MEKSEFDIIYEEIESKYYEHERKRLSNRKRKRDAGAGRPFRLKVRKDLLCFSILQAIQAIHYIYIIRILFDIDQSNVCRDLTILELLVRKCIPLPQKIYKHTARIRTRRLKIINEVEQYFPSLKAFIDSTEQEIPRAKNKGEDRKLLFRKREETHCINCVFMVNTNGLILHKTCYERGRIQDYDVCENNRPVTSSQVENIVDLGYLGIQIDFPTKSVLPFKKRKGASLSSYEVTYNKNQSY